MKHPKLLIIGIDGFNLPVFQILSQQGYLPYLTQLQSQTSPLPLHSSFPPTTAPAWSTFATGTSPDQHQVYNFIQPQDSLSSPQPVTSHSLQTPTFYQNLTQNNLDPILINLPVSWPPLTQHPTITSLLTQSDNPVYPRSLTDQFPLLQNYHITPPDFPRHKRYRFSSRYIKAVQHNEKVRFQSTQKLLAHLDWNLFFVLFSGHDWFSHHIYHQLLNQSAPDSVYQYYSQLDNYIKNLHRQSQAPLILLSDHGFQVTHHQFRLHLWLKKALPPDSFWTDGWNIFLKKPTDSAKQSLRRQLLSLKLPDSSQKIYSQAKLISPGLTLQPADHHQSEAHQLRLRLYSHHQQNDHHPQGFFLSPSDQFSHFTPSHLSEIAPAILKFFNLAF